MQELKGSQSRAKAPTPTPRVTTQGQNLTGGALQECILTKVQDV